MVKEIDVKSILTINKHPSAWFGVKYGMNIYRGCQHGCIYCDSRSECYRIENFDDIIVKKNAVEILKKQIKRK
jgi:DNA repair photolyase